MTAPDRNARVTDRNEPPDIGPLVNLVEAWKEAARKAWEIKEQYRTALAAMTADRDRWRALAEKETGA